MSRATDYLKSRAVIYINLDRVADRRAQFEAEVAPLFEMKIRLPATDGAVHVTDADAQKFRDDWARVVETRGDELSSINRAPGERFLLDRMKSTYAIYLSHLRALQYGAQYFSRFFVAEDDIMPKNALFEDDFDLPDPESQMNIWSGGLPMAALKTDDDAYRSGMTLRWRTLPTDKNAHNVLGAGLVEYTNSAARLILKEVQENPMPFDHAWGFGIKQLYGQRLFPTAFGQMGTSIRNGKHRDQVLVRDAV